MVKSTFCSLKGPRFDSQQPLVGSLPSIIPVSGDPTLTNVGNLRVSSRHPMTKFSAQSLFAPEGRDKG